MVDNTPQMGLIIYLKDMESKDGSQQPRTPEKNGVVERKIEQCKKWLGPC